MIKLILMALFGIFGVYLAMKLAMLLIPYALVGGGLYLGYRWLGKKLLLSNDSVLKSDHEVVKEIDVKVVEEELKATAEPKSLEDRIAKLKEGNS